ncbi:MAG: diguanylate cyclase [Chloroflexales bacterium]
MRILIVEDEALIARDLATTVESFGHAVVGVTSSGEDALTLAATQQPDLVLMDIRLSGSLDGIATAQQMHIPTVYLTAHADDETMRRAAATQPAGYLLKPFDERALWSTLELAAHRSYLEHQLQISEASLRERNAELEVVLRAQERRIIELSILGNLGRALTSCATVEQGYTVIAHAAQQLFPEVAGGLYVACHTPNTLDPVVVWGSAPHPHPPLHAAHCRVLREQRNFLGAGTCGGCRCEALPPGMSTDALCVLLSVAGETLGVIHTHLMTPDSTGVAKALQRQLAMALGEQAALGLANVRLRATLREQAIRDPLTGLMNRRYLEETLMRELRRASRDCYPVGVIMLDVDHFKRINDTYGHDAGDSVLRALGVLLGGMVRAEDVACRYGGEEFVLILPAAPIAVVADRAEAIRNAISSLEIAHDNLALPPITASLGASVVANPQASISDALAQADAALYAAKRAGRNRVVTQEPD